MDLTNILILIITIIVTYIIANYIGKKQMQKLMHELLEEERKEFAKKSKSVIKGQISEQLSPYLPNFPQNPSECKFLGKPIDFIAFKGLDKEQVSEIVFIEVKTGNAKLNETEKSIQQTIENGNITFKTYNPEKNSQTKNF